MLEFVQGNFIDGSAVVYRKNNLSLQKGLKFQDGRIFFPQSLYFGDFSCGLAGMDTGKSFGYIDRNGRFKVKPIYKTGNDFVQGRALVSTSMGTFLINTVREILWGCKICFVTNTFNDGYALIAEISSDGEFHRDAFINLDGSVITSFTAWQRINYPGELNNPNDFYSDGLIRFYEDGKYGFKNLNGEIVIYPNYDLAYFFREGLAAVQKNGKAGYIDKEGKEVIPFNFLAADNFSEGLASVLHEDKWGCINKYGEPVIPFEFDGLEEFKEGEIPFRENGKCGLMNRDLKIIVEPKYDSITHFNEGILKYSLKFKEGVRDREGNELMSDLLIGCEYNMFN